MAFFGRGGSQGLPEQTAWGSPNTARLGLEGSTRDYIRNVDGKCPGLEGEKGVSVAGCNQVTAQAPSRATKAFFLFGNLLRGPANPTVRLQPTAVQPLPWIQ